MERELRRILGLTLGGLAVVGLLVSIACGGASSNSDGANEAEPTPRREQGTVHDPSICPNECFLNEGECLMVPEEPEEMRGDEVPVLEPEPCDPQCCEEP